MNKDKLEYALSLSTSAFTGSVKLAAGSVSKMDKEIKRSVRNSSKALGGLAKSMAKVGTAAGVAAAGGLYAFNKVMQEAVALANEQEKVETRLAAVIKATGNAAGYTVDELKGMASGLQEITTVGDETTLAGMAILATFKEIKGDNFEAATKAALDMSEVMGTDLKSSMVMLGKALNDPAKGLSALSRSGVTFTDTQKAMIKEMVAVGDTAGAQKVMLAELNSEFGGAAEAARTTFGGSMIAAGNALGDLKEELGYVITKNKFFIDAAKTMEKIFIKMTGAITANKDEWMLWAKESALAVLEMAADAANGLSSIYSFLQNLSGVLSLSKAGFLTLAKTIQYLFKLSNQLFGDDNKAQYWADAMVESQRLIDDAFASTAKAFEAAENGLPILDKTAEKIRALKDELAAVDAVDVSIKPETDIPDTPELQESIAFAESLVAKPAKKDLAPTTATADPEVKESEKAAMVTAKLSKESAITTVATSSLGREFDKLAMVANSLQLEFSKIISGLTSGQAISASLPGMTPSDRALSKVNARYDQAEATSNNRGNVAKIVELRFPGGSLQGSEASADAFLNQLEMAGLRA